ncbi:DUF2244 domain-containing protein [Afipia felis]|uniref:Integral membrane protein (DUF2244) n=2 Tax=Afipia felis TaxID=1035 RepID=A0A380W2C0_AFIFE|nr:DUF2244 domain-containing protein [Afipia felis]EKS30165.1 hypothetical protein HMPREF9697_02693 [Afipia felis ATCC 53690]SUU74910.1 Integral membrane protein (DUF2244) [Afipia felis]SUU82976.1 Integral membrane protein (DUF2244) [Afipia felis]
MSSGNDFPDIFEQPIFTAELTPHRSLSRRGFIILMTFLCVVSFTAGIVFLRMGAWPVFGFFGLDVLLIYWAFRVNYARARASEHLVLTPHELRLRRVSHRGHVMEWTFNPHWVRLDQEEHEEFGIERLYLTSHGRSVAVGSFLGPDEKASFAKALRLALQDAKRGPTYNPL